MRKGQSRIDYFLGYSARNQPPIFVKNYIKDQESIEEMEELRGYFYESGDPFYRVLKIQEALHARAEK